MRHSIRDKNGRFVKGKKKEVKHVFQNEDMTAAFNEIIHSSPRIIREDGKLMPDPWGGKPLDTSTNNGSAINKPNRFFFALFWATIGFITGVIFEMFVQLFTK